jgi:phosphoserine aminotransferase
VHVTSNNTLFGTQWPKLPKTAAPLVVDASSDVLSAPLDLADVGLLYAGAQKNLGPSGLTLVVVRNDVLAAGRTDIPKIFRYASHAKERSLYHTPPTFAVYLARNVLRWIDGIGGLAAIEARNRQKAELLYATLDGLAPFYRAPVERESRSRMNVVWNLATPALEDEFVKESKQAGLIGLKGHRSTGGLRASLYNAVSIDDVRALTAFMTEFARRRG